MKLRVLSAAALCAIFLCAAAPAIPGTPAGRQFAHWLELFNGGQRDAILKYQTVNDPSAAQHIDGTMEFRRMTGGFDLQKIEESTPSRLTGIVKERASDNFARFVLDVAPAPPHQIKSLDLQPVPRPSDLAAVPRLTEPNLVAALKADLQQRTASGQFSGAVMIARGPSTVFSAAYGLADRQRKIANRVDTRFRIGSMNKMFTATAVLQLAQAGKLKFTDPIGKYLTDYPNREIASKVTVHQLLTHTGGTGDIFTPEFEQNRLKLRDLKDYVALYGKRPPLFAPGARFEYSNYGFILLGVLIEKISGQSYYDYVRQHIFQAAGMTRTDSLPEDQNVEGRAQGYMREGAQWDLNTDTLPVRGTSAGGGYSTVADLVAFARAVMSHKLLNAEYTALLTTGKVEGGRGGGKYAYGFSDATVDGLRWIGHGGGAPGMNGDLKFCPDSGYIIAVLSNFDPPTATRVSDYIAARLPAR